MKKEMNRCVSFIFHHHVDGIALKPNFYTGKEVTIRGWRRMMNVLIKI
jgi:hypothetical protein